ncbi:MAG: hypothetical protein JWO85_3382 [Candidatus Eremiobacteraeota bacterium]|nr:hypothetical protein [Candidatus Eremiobacteraeota bacterium]
MKSLIQLVPAYVLALFDGETVVAEPVVTPAAVVTPAVEQPRGKSGQFVVPNTEDPKELRRALEDLGRNYERDLGSAQSRIGELNAENEKHRNRFKETKSTLDTVSAQVAASNQRVLRADARDALTAAGALSSRVVDLFLADMGDKVKIDPKTGEPIGIAEALPEWKKANTVLFKAETAEETEAEKTARLAAEATAAAAAAKGNSTAKGASTAAATATDTTATGGLPDLRNLTAPQRKVALTAYRNSLRPNR